MKIRFVSWNVRGLNEKNKRMIIRAFIRAQKVDLVCFQETKLQEMSDRMVRSLGGGQRALNAQGVAGGIVVFWDIRVIQLVEVEEGSFSVSCRFMNTEDNLLWFFTGVYDPIANKDREGLWHELRAVRGLWNVPWCVARDFNITRKGVGEVD